VNNRSRRRNGIYAGFCSTKRGEELSADVIGDEPPGTRDRLMHDHRAFRRTLTAVVERGQSTGRLDDGDAEEMVTCYLATLTGLVTTWFAPGKDVSIPRAETVMRLFAGGVDD
jgi:hypothetical protein